jgi:hypothetical protein
VLCAIAGIPHLFGDEEPYEIAKKYYPGIDAKLVDRSELSPRALLENYDHFYVSQCWDRESTQELFQSVFPDRQIELRSVYCPHGNSDKTEPDGGLNCYLNHDVLLVYGQHMVDLLKETKVWDALKKKVITGNFRYSYYKKHQAFYDRIVQEEVLSRFADNGNQTLLYAPTWSADFFTAAAHVLDNLPSHYNIIVKIHHRLMHDHLGAMIRMMGYYENRPNILFLEDFPPVYPLLSHVDIFIGDVSSIGYDFLAFNRPMFFMRISPNSPNPEREFLLYRCGIELQPEQYPQLYEIMEAHLQSDQTKWQEERRKMYEYAFGQERPWDELSQELHSVFH